MSNLWNSTFKNPGKPLQRKTGMQAKQKPVQRSREKRGKGLAQRVAESLGRAVQHARGESQLLRSEQHRRNVASLGCLITGKPAQACHVNFGKGMGLKACDSLCFPLSPELAPRTRPGRLAAHGAHQTGVGIRGQDAGRAAQAEPVAGIG